MSTLRLIAISSALAYGVLLTAAHAQQPSASVRAAWEYKTVTLEQGVDPNNQFASGTKFYEDGQPLSTPVRERANQLGMQGWELVSVAATENQTYRVHVYWFKRQRP